jgi:hypothetical protein
VAHLTLRDLDWLEAQLERDGVLPRHDRAGAGGREAALAPGPGSRLAAFVQHGVSPVFHVADQPRVFDDAWYTDPRDGGIFALDSVFLYVPAALATTDLILNGVLERHPGLRLGIVELSAVWVPMYLMMLEGGSQFVAHRSGRERALALRPSDYFRRQVRVSCFAYELPARIAKQLGSDDVLMA